MATAAVRGRLTWQVATVAALSAETPSVTSIDLAVPDWAGHRPGQHLDIRLTAEDGYVAERSYSIASAPGEPLRLTVERLADGEVSPFLTQELRSGDQIEIRGPIGGYFGWDGDGPAMPLLLVAGGSGIVPFRSMLRHRAKVGSDVAVRLVYSARTVADVIYRAELCTPVRGVEVVCTLTRQQPPDWTGRTGRVDAALLGDVAWPPERQPTAFVCGPTPFVEAVATELVTLGYPADLVKTERFGGAG
jgi:ferredoxin-NADP reductase